MSLSPDQPPPASPPAKPKITADTWPALYAAGAALREISERTGFTKKRVRQELLARGVIMRPQNRRGTRNRTSAWHETAVELRAGGVSFFEIGRRFGKTEQAVRIALRRLAAKAPTQPAAAAEAGWRDRSAAPERARPKGWSPG
jgi:hypothetical protein